VTQPRCIVAMAAFATVLDFPRSNSLSDLVRRR
jgi:hypothetical protein